MNTYIEGWRLGLKAIAIYRDGSKRSAPLNAKKTKDMGSSDLVEALASAPVPAEAGIEEALSGKAELERRIVELERRSRRSVHGSTSRPGTGCRHPGLAHA